MSSFSLIRVAMVPANFSLKATPMLSSVLLWAWSARTEVGRKGLLELVEEDLVLLIEVGAEALGEEVNDLGEVLHTGTAVVG